MEGKPNRHSHQSTEKVIWLFCMMVKRCLTFTVLLISAAAVFAQASGQVERILKTRPADAIGTDIRTLASQTLQQSEKLYLNGLSQVDAQRAVDYYTEVLNSFPKSSEAELACLRIAQYHFARGFYVAARKFFRDLLQWYPNSKYVDEAAYGAASCLYAQKEYSACRGELERFVKKYPDSPYKEIVRQDLKDLRALSSGYAAAPEPVKSTIPSGKFTLQIGAFTNANLAVNLREEFENKGYLTEVRKKHVNGKTFYQVLLNAFDDRDEAEAFGAMFKKKYGKPYRIIVK